MTQARRHSSGIVLIVVLLFLVLISMFSVSAFRASTTNLRATQAMTIRQEAQSAAQWAIEDTISTLDFQAASAPFAVVKDVTGDGSNDYTVTVTVPDCVKIRFLKMSEVPRDPATGLPKGPPAGSPPGTADWRTCDPGGGGSGPGSGGTGGSVGLIEWDSGPGGAATNVTSYCAEALWDVQARVQDQRTRTVMEVRQGVGVPHPIDTIDKVCTRS